MAVFKRAVELSPYAGHEKYMYLSQLVDGPESLEYSSRGIELLKRACACEEEDAQYAEDLRGQLCQAICSTVETMLNIPEFLSSSSHPGRAEDAARMLEEAQASSPQSPEPAQVKASLLVEVGGREEEARAALRHSMSLWYVRPESLCGGDQDEQGGGMEVDGRDGTGAESHLREGCAPPSFEFRFETAKLIMELEDDARDSLAILEGTYGPEYRETRLTRFHHAVALREQRLPRTAASKMQELAGELASAVEHPRAQNVWTAPRYTGSDYWAGLLNRTEPGDEP